MTGAKAFSLRGTIHGPMLFSPAMETPWLESRMVARYIGDFGPKDPDLLQPAGRGIHCYRNLRTAIAAQFDSDENQRTKHPGKDAAYAIVRPEGDTIIGEHGWVSEAAVIVRIFLPRHLYAAHARALYDRYRVPVELLPRPKWTLPPVLPPPRPADLWLMAHYAPEIRPRLARDVRSGPTHGHLYLDRPRIFRAPYIHEWPVAIYNPAIPALYGPWRKDYGLAYRVTHGKYRQRYAEFRATLLPANRLPSGRRRSRAKPNPNRDVVAAWRERQQRKSRAEKEAIQWLAAVRVSTVA
jgi:hypothetical protein